MMRSGSATSRTIVEFSIKPTQIIEVQLNSLDVSSHWKQKRVQSPGVLHTEFRGESSSICLKRCISCVVGIEMENFTLVPLTARQLAESRMPELPVRTSQRRSSTQTDPVSPRTFANLKEWPNFKEDAGAILLMLDNETPKYVSPTNLYPLAPCADEVGVRGALETLLFPAVEILAPQLHIPFAFRSGGSGRSYSYTDMVILDLSAPQGVGERMELSHRVYGNGEAKGPWQWEVQGARNLLEVLQDAKKGAKTIETVQQLFGDMVLDESKYGFISNYNQTIFFRRADDVKDKTLEFSPTILVGESPLISFLFVLFRAHGERAVKHLLPRASVPFTPKWGYTMTLPRVTSTSAQGRRRTHSESTIVLEAGGKRPRTGTKRFFEVELLDFSVGFYTPDAFNSLPDYKLEDLGLTGQVVGLGTYGNVLVGVLGGCLPVAIKLFDFRIKGAREAFVREQQGYKYLKPLQGKCVPILYAVGSMAHCNMVFMALSDEGISKLGTSPLTRSLKKQVLEALDDIHNHGILHNDVKLEHVLISQGAPKFIDFQGSSTSASHEDFKAEQNFMRVLLEDESEA